MRALVASADRSRVASARIRALVQARVFRLDLRRLLHRVLPREDLPHGADERVDARGVAARRVDLHLLLDARRQPDRRGVDEADGRRIARHADLVAAQLLQRRDDVAHALGLVARRQGLLLEQRHAADPVRLAVALRLDPRPGDAEQVEHVAAVGKLLVLRDRSDRHDLEDRRPLLVVRLPTGAEHGHRETRVGLQRVAHQSAVPRLEDVERQHVPGKVGEARKRKEGDLEDGLSHASPSAPTETASQLPRRLASATTESSACFSLCPFQMERPRTLGELRRAGYRSRSVRDELRANLLLKIRDGAPRWSGIVGYEQTVLPQIENAILAKQDLILLGLRGQAKTRLLRLLVELLDEAVPAVEGAPLNDDPFAPVSGEGKRVVAERGDATPIQWIGRDVRYHEKLATPDTTIADLIGDIDPIKAASRGLSYADEGAIHYGLIPRTNRGIVAINELPDLQPRIQVGLLNVLEERDVQIRGFPVRLDLDVVMVF